MLVLAVAAPATAHVTITPSTTQAGAHAVLQVSVGHGCEGSATTAVTIRIPESIPAVTPTRHPLWDVSTKVVPVDPPIVDDHGTRIVERVASVTYRTDDPLPDGQRDVLELALRLPDDAGSTLVFPTIQTCEQGGSAWIEVPADGQDPDALELPAPSFVLSASAAGTPSPASAVDTLSAAARRGPGDGVRQDRGSSEAPLLSLGALGVAVLGVLVGVAALAQQRRRP